MSVEVSGLAARQRVEMFSPLFFHCAHIGINPLQRCGTDQDRIQPAIDVFVPLHTVLQRLHAKRRAFALVTGRT